MALNIASARYGKDNVRLYKVERDRETNFQVVTEMTVTVLLEGDFASSYAHADNSRIVATDSMKNTIYIKAKQHPVNPPELFASILGQHFIDTYSHLSVAHIDIIIHRWTRMTIDGEPHPHSFLRDGAETRHVEAILTRDKAIQLRSGIAGLLVLKSTGSQFYGFIRDDFTTLPETWDRVLSTEIDCRWSWAPFAHLDAIKTAADAATFDRAWDDARRITLKTFAEENSPSVQNVMYKMSQYIFDAVPDVQGVEYTLPNKHYFELDLSWHHNLQNTGDEAEVYIPQSGANGLIKLAVTRPSPAPEPAT